MPLTPGRRLGPYEITAAIGAGGMGEVYRARDTRLNRDVAVKVLPEAFASDPDRLARFEREAQAVAALSHPNILAIHDVGAIDRTAYVVMELLHGETLRQRLAAGPPGVRKALAYAAQIARGLASAHDHGIVHRDLKPENIFVTADGQIKVLDFGLARHMVPALSGSDRTVSGLTEPGVVMGTAGYMSPEQVTGSATVDFRSDIFSFGAVLYEMLSGRRAFNRETAAETMTAVLREEPPGLTQPDGPIPAAVDHLVRRCLEKRPGERFQSAHDLAFALEQHAETGVQPSVRHELSLRRRLSRLVLPAAVVVVAALAFLAGRWMAPAPSDRIWTGSGFSPVTTSEEAELWPHLAPDGKSVVYSSAVGGNMDIYALRIGGHNATNLTADSPAVDDQPTFSPDGTRIAFRSTREGGGIFTMGATGESVRRVSDFGFNPAWSPDSRFLAVSDATFVLPNSRPRPGKLWVISLADGSRRELPSGDGVQPAWSPKGRRIAYWGTVEGGQRDIWTIAADGSAGPVRVTADAALDWNPVWSPDGGALYFATDRAGTMNIARVAIDEDTGHVSGPPEMVIVPAGSAGSLSFSSDGRTLLYGTDRIVTTLYAASVDSSGSRLAGPPQVVLTGAQQVDYVDVSPDGLWIAFGTAGRQEDLFVIRTDGTGLRQLTDDPHLDRGPRWSPDGSRLAFYSNRQGPYAIWSIRPDGSRLEPLSPPSKERSLTRPIWAPDGRRIAATRSDDGAGVVLHLERPLEARLQALDGLPRPFRPKAWSPDGSVLAATQDQGAESDRIFLYSLAGVPHVTHRTQSQIWEGSIAWLDDRRVLFATEHGAIAVLDARTGEVHELLPRARRLGEFPVIGKALKRPVMAFVEMRTEGDLWVMRRQ